MTITAVTFDLWQTLLIDNRELGLIRTARRLEGAREALAAFGEDYDPDHLREAYRACYRHCREVRERLLDVSFDEQVAVFVENISPGLLERLDAATLREITAVYADSFLEYPPPPHADALPALQGVKDMGMKIGLISNTGMTPGTTFRTYLGSMGMLDFFDALTFSDEVKLSKPSGEIFRITLDSLGVSTDEVVHVGDHIKNDVVGAKRCGIKTVWITGFSEREDPDDPATEPDETVDSLGAVVPAIHRLRGA